MALADQDMSIADYDGRTALHLAAAEGQLDCVKFLLEKCQVPPNPRDRSVTFHASLGPGLLSSHVMM